MIMNSITARTRIKKSIQGFEDLEITSQSSKELEDLDTEITGIRSDRTLNIFDDECQIAKPEVVINDTRQNRKSHIFIKMSARINGVEFSPDNMKASKLFEVYQQNTRSSEGFKKVSEKNLDNSKVFQKIVEKQAQITRLKDENKKLIIANQELKGIGEHRKNIRSIDRIYSPSQSLHQGIRIFKREEITNPLIQKLKIEEQLSKTEQIKIQLEKRVLDLEAQIVNKDQNIKDIMKQSQHQINLLYQNLSKRLKAKQVQSYMNGKYLKQQKQKTNLLQQQLTKSNEQKGRFTVVMNNYSKEKQQLLSSIRLQQDQLRKSKIVSLRLDHCENQLKYMNQQLKNSKQELSVHRLQNINLQSELTKTKKQLSNIITKPINNSYAEIIALRSSITVKEEQILKYKNQSSNLQIVQKQLITMSKRYVETYRLLLQANQQIMKLSLTSLSNTMPKKLY